MLSITTIRTPIGSLQAIAQKDFLVGLLKEETLQQAKAHFEHKAKTSFQWSSQFPNTITDAIHAYFSGSLDCLTKIPHDWLYGTPFQKKVWTALMAIPAGTVMSYNDIARAIQQPKASRAVGMACHHNPLLLKVPCHRVIGKNQALTGFAIGLKTKAWLIEHERENS